VCICLFETVEPVDGYTTKKEFVTHGQCDARFMFTFPATEHYHYALPSTYSILQRVGG